MCGYSGIYRLVGIKHNVINVIYMANLCKSFFIFKFIGAMEEITIMVSQIFDSPNLKLAHLVLEKLESFHVL